MNINANKVSGRIRQLMEQCGHTDSVSVYTAFMQFANEFSQGFFNVSTTCHNCDGAGYVVKSRAVCCGKNPDGSCHGDCPIEEQYQESCECDTEQQKTAEPCEGEPYRLSIEEQGVMRNALRKSVTVIEQQQPATPTQIDAGELEEAIDLVDGYGFGEDHAANMALNKVIEAARAHLKTTGGWLPIPILKGITLGHAYSGKITEQEALDLVNEIIRVQNNIASGDYEDITDSIDNNLEHRHISEITGPQPPEVKE